MYLLIVVAATIAAAGPLVNAHGAGLPKIVGLDPADVKSRDLLLALEERFSRLDHAQSEPALATRTSAPECGPGVGSCPAGECCSRAFFCGTSKDHCYSPGCNYKYGPGCAENQAPAGTNTSSISRDKLGSIPYGGNGTFRCTKPGTVAITYDDGPQKDFTEHILDQFKSYGAKATFFVTGNNINKGQIDVEYADVIKRMSAEGHQIASHTWTHLDLSEISSEDRKNQIIMNEMAIRNILGKIPTYLRPPYSSCTEISGCQKDVADLGYHITNFNVDTDDYNLNTAEDIQIAKDNFHGNITSKGATAKDHQWLAIGHDILEQTANNLTGFMLETITKLGYKAVTVGECLEDPEENWYRAADGAGISPDNETNPISSDSGSNTTSPSATPAASATGAGSATQSYSIATIALAFTMASVYVL
ncbi:hypothetical protein IAQ61_007359 [Plenodomus lingam]|uniref:Chitin deacetylase n=1 Tax=Leptosphaeria maculans (strain JN3 / isolate v23.1.3 / race Av1-4-5-6-7-8) TaxID=985895 RepID=E5A0T0_LEPMJ|nr:hypothetical protein LEMA_P103570.1 [Plenodomus lingam JN3]KAH9868052.1 hypothetical protein IAQ61_007359 [Plenodomus lingam]CBX97226.1 hypothetical protein LEMA_P103570.1 [Plenodomus lingam JN3]